MVENKHISMVAIFINIADMSDLPVGLAGIVKSMVNIKPLQVEGVGDFYVCLSPLPILDKMCESNIHTMEKLMTCPMNRSDATELFGNSSWDITEYVRYFK